MLFRNAAAVAAAGFIAFSFGAPANALTAKECSEKYKAAQEAKTLGNKSWNDFQRFECGADAKPAGATPAAAPAATAPGRKSGGDAVRSGSGPSRYRSRHRGRQGPDLGRVQRQVQGRQGRRHARRQEVERLP